MKWISFTLVPVFLFAAACSEPRGTQSGAISEDALRQHIKILSSDEFEGRGPSSPGEEKTVAYLAKQFQSYGLKPINGDSYFQDVPLVEITAAPSTVLTVDAGAGSVDLANGGDMMVWTKRVVESVSVSDSDMVFVGYGINAPEYDWNDYDGVDVTGKTVVILVNDPGYATQDAELFNGNAMTYYGRWTYKYEEAARQGAAAALIIHETRPAAYPWEVVTGSWSGPQFDLVRDDDNMSRVAVEGWIQERVADDLFSRAGLDFDALKKAALTGDFKALPMGDLKASISIENSLRRSISRNVIGYVKGSERPEEYFLYMAHWDHLGKDPGLEGDQIYNGALDNATGTAGLLELARHFANPVNQPRRSVVFVAVTAEEQGLLGSAYYASAPVFPLNKTVAGINMDGLSIIGKTRDVTVIGFGASELENYLREAASEQDRVVEPEPTPENGYYYRSDHFNLAKVGVPMLYTEAGVDSRLRGREWGLAQGEDYVANRYHKPADEYDPDWDLSGAVEDLELFYAIGKRIANGNNWPNWYEGTEFRAIRDESMGQ